jgi:hypothetical protein
VDFEVSVFSFQFSVFSFQLSAGAGGSAVWGVGAVGHGLPIRGFDRRGEFPAPTGERCRWLQVSNPGNLKPEA